MNPALAAPAVLSVIRKTLWTAGVVAGVLTAYALLGLVVFALTGADPVGGTLVLAIVTAGLVMVLRTLRPHWFSYRQPPGNWHRDRMFMTLSLLLVLATFVFGQAMALLIRLSTAAAGDSPVLNAQRPAAGVLLLVLVAAPLGEEALFRGAVFPLLRRKVGLLLSILVTTVMFGLMHGNAIQFAASAPLAVLLALVYERTRSLSLAVLVHLLFNAGSLFISENVVLPLANIPAVLCLFLVWLVLAGALCQRIVAGPAPAVAEGKP